MRLLTAEQVAKRLGVGRATVFRWLAAGKLPAPVPQPGSRLRWSCEDLERWEASGFKMTTDAKKTDTKALRVRLDAIEGRIRAAQAELKALKAEQARARSEAHDGR